MEHFTRAMEKLLKPTGKRISQSFLGEVHKYLSTGDEKLMGRLLKLDDANMNTLCRITAAAARPDKWGDAEIRFIKFLVRRCDLFNGKDKGEPQGQCSDWPLPKFLERHLESEKPDEDFCGMLRAQVLALGVAESRWLTMVVRHMGPRAIKGKLTSVGRYLVAQPPAKLLPLLGDLRYDCFDVEFMPAFATEAPKALGALLDEVIRRKKADDLPRGSWVAAVEKAPSVFEKRAVTALSLMREGEDKSLLAKCLEKHFPGKYRKRNMEAARNIGAASGGEEQAAAARWLIEQEGDAAVASITNYIAKWNLQNPYIQDWKIEVLRESAKLLGSKLRPSLAAAMQKDMPELRHGALELWIGFRDPVDNKALEKQLLQELASTNPKHLLKFIPLAASWNAPQIAPRLWELLEDKSKPVRESAVTALSKLGNEVVPEAEKLLQAKKMEPRRVAALLLIAVGTPQSWQVLQSHLERETADDVRDLIRKAQAKQNKLPAAPPPQPVAKSDEASLEITQGGDFLGVTLPNAEYSFRIAYPVIHRKRIVPVCMLSLAMDIFGAESTEAAEQTLLDSLKSDNPSVAIGAMAIAMTLNVDVLTPYVWPLLQSKSKWIREATAELLGKFGNNVLPKATELLTVRKVDVRKAAIALLVAVGTEGARQVLRDHLKHESSEEIRDLVQKALVKGIGKSQTAKDKATSGNSPTQKANMVDQQQVEAAIASAAPKIKNPAAAWIDESALPAIYFADGKPLNKDAVRYLLYRQSREKEMAADTEAALLYAVIDRKRSGDFALAVLNGYLSSQLDAKDRWALAIAGLLGDDRIVPILTRRIAEWAEAARGKLAEYAVQALALLASDAALLAVDGLAIRYRTKFKNIGKAASQAFAAAADARGLSPAELGDRVLPWLGFEPGKPRVLEFGDNRVEVSISSEFKLAWRDLVKGKPIKSLPASVPDDLKTAMKELSAGLKEAAKAQLLRMENLMVQQHRWPAARWTELFLQHPLIFPFATRLVWGALGADKKVVATFRALEDHSLTDASDEPFTLPTEGSIGIVHPLELTSDQRQAWLKHLADYNVVPPFAQLERPVATLKAGQEKTNISKDLEGTELNAMTFKGRAERLGWARGSVIDGGGISYYHKQFPAAGVDVFIGLDGMYVGIDMYSDITLGKVMFVKHRSVQVGSYTYDEPSGEKDERIVPFGKVPAIAFSEAMGDLAKISGKSGGQSTEGEDA